MINYVLYCIEPRAFSMSEMRGEYTAHRHPSPSIVYLSATYLWLHFLFYDFGCVYCGYVAQRDDDATVCNVYVYVTVINSIKFLSE